MGCAAPREIPDPARISQPACTEASQSGLPSLPCSHRSDNSFLHMLFICYTFFPKWCNYSFRRRLPFYVIFILCIKMIIIMISIITILIMLIIIMFIILVFIIMIKINLFINYQHHVGLYRYRMVSCFPCSPGAQTEQRRCKIINCGIDALVFLILSRIFYRYGC